MASSPDIFPVVLRPMCRDDLDAVCALEREAYPTPWTQGMFADCLQAGYSAWVLSCASGDVSGYALLSMAAGEGHILNICIAPARQGQGHGRRLLEHLLEIARHAGTEILFLEVRVSNQRAAQLYTATGFKMIGRRPGYYPCPDGGREDADIYALGL